jgi:hypothetical protein
LARIVTDGVQWFKNQGKRKKGKGKHPSFCLLPFSFSFLSFIIPSMAASKERAFVAQTSLYAGPGMTPT